jgi:hypothetical protein
VVDIVVTRVIVGVEVRVVECCISI